MSAPSPLPAAPRVMLVVTHLLGIGHLARMAAVGRALAAEGWPVTLVSGGRPAPTVDAGGCAVIQLPPVHCLGTDFTTFHTPEGLADAAYLDRRRAALRAAFDAVAPDVLVTELFPFGRRALAAEFEALLAHAAARRPRPLVLASIRDVLNPSSRPDRIAEAEARLAAHYDGVLFHGDSALVPLAASWPVGPSLARRLIETGYVHDGARALEAGGTVGADEIIVSGGGSAAGLPLCHAALEAAARLPGHRWRLLVGHGVAAEAFAALLAAAPANMVVERARPDFPALLARAALSVSQAGYNTVLDLAAAGARAVLVPFAAGKEQEQGIRAAELARRGLARVLDEAALDGPALAAQVAAGLALPPPDWSAVRREGAARTAPLIRAGLERRADRDAAWRELDAALGEAEVAGRTVDLWWRDDDAIAPTPALDRLLARAARFGVPLALATIPSRAGSALADRLDGAPDVDLLVHGWAHADHAPAGAKKAEFDHRPVPAMLEEAREGLARGRTLFGDRLLPVFVPPWNRIGRPLAARLGEVGYRGLSTFGPRGRGAQGRAKEGPLAPGLIEADTHLDPIAWRAGGGLDEEAMLVRRLVGLIGPTGPIVHPIEPDSAPIGPIGLLTHHLVHDAFVDAFLDRLLARLCASPAIRWRAARAIFASREEGPTA
ncbi:glycosyltransferase [Ancylobacter terrae]|uniref:glycosyltransferase n=1 Tax=Ancylobacter sp. sgz301288 TaxID=3342077 RepID=UPI00385825DA